MNTKAKFRWLALPLVLILLLIGSMTALSACDNGSKAEYVRFGEFGYNGKYLTSFATKMIDSVKAKEILSNLNISVQTASGNKAAASVQAKTYTLHSDENEGKPSAEQINFMLSKYSGCQVLTKYYIEGTENQVEKTNEYVGTDFKNMLQENQVVPFAQLVAKYLLCYSRLIDVMEERNELFQQSPTALLAPFRNIFTYHTNEKGELVIQTRDFAEVPSSVGGGISSNYRQDTEILYDAENKIQKWQTSLGLYTATPDGTMKQGYILEVQFNWMEKI